MFDLEKSITNWRQQMFDAGIKTPVPLKELEVHLREEIEQQIKSGLSEPEAFKIGIQKIGQGPILQDEFKKVRKDGQLKRAGQQIIRSITLIIGWLVAGFLLFCGVVFLDLDWNLFSFHVRWDGEAFFEVLIILVTEIGVWFLAKTSRDRGSRVVSLLICLFLAGIGLFSAVSTASPFWYRGGMACLFCLPSIFWARWELQRFAQERDSSYEDQPMRSN
jgi:hypothetical protein